MACLPVFADGNYASNGAYFVTVCTANRRPLLGTLEGESVMPSVLGELAVGEIVMLASRHDGVVLDTCVLMPDHVHVVVMLMGRREGRVTLTGLIAAWKAGVTREALRRARPAICAPLWQRGFYDRVIRNDAELDAVRAYIATNPLRLALRRRAVVAGLS